MGLEEIEHLSIERFILTFAIILMASKIFGELSEKIKQPSVLGELVVGVLLGASVFAIVPSEAHQVGYHTFHLLAELGVAVLLFEIGLETDLDDLIKVGTTSTIVAIVGVTLPFILGFACIFGFLELGFNVGDPTLTTIIAITVGATLTATSVGITARVLSDMNKLQAKESKIILGAAVIDDILGLIILGVVSGLIGAFKEGADTSISFLSVGIIILKAIVFLAVSIFVGNLVCVRVFDFIARMRVRGSLVVFALSFGLIFAILASFVGLAPIVGAFAGGLVVRRTNQYRKIEESLKPVSDVITPIFFIMIGAAVNVAVFNPLVPENHNILIIGLVLFVVAVVGKFVSGYAIFQKGINKMAVGIGMIPRGEVGLIFAQVGLKYRVFDSNLFSAITVMVMLTTFIVPPLLQIVFKDRNE